MPTKEYKHAEAFCLMKYECEDCKKSEVLWNSRDGVTPFIIGCSSCKGAMLHTDFHLDKRMPNYTPQKGQRIFVDLDMKTAIKVAKKRIESVRSMKGFEDPFIPNIEDIAKSMYGDGKSPHIITFGEEENQNGSQKQTGSG